MDKKSARIRRAARARHMMREQGVTRLVVHRTPRHIYAQVIAPNGSEVLAAASLFPVYFTCSLITFSTVEAAASTSEPFGAIT